jgi:hypothetical protein
MRPDIVVLLVRETESEVGGRKTEGEEGGRRERKGRERERETKRNREKERDRWSWWVNALFVMQAVVERRWRVVVVLVVEVGEALMGREGVGVRHDDGDVSREDGAW